MLKYFRNHHLYKMQNIAGYGSPPRTIYQDRSPSSVNARAYLARYDVDRRSIFVGNLPAGVTEDEIKQVFNQYGPIRDIMLRESPSRFACKLSISLLWSRSDIVKAQEKIHFGFIQFKSTVEADKVIDDVVRDPPPPSPLDRLRILHYSRTALSFVARDSALHTRIPKTEPE